VNAAIKTLDSIVIRKPIKKKNKKQQNLCLDKGYYSAAEIQCQVLKRRYIPNIPQRGEKKKYIEKRKEEGDGW
jgi:hypothetical protein